MTSDQYKYLLMRKLQQSFSMKYSKDRAYTQSFFWALFDDSVTVTESAYNEFVSIMDDQLDEMAALGVYLCEDVPSQYITDNQYLLVNAFAAIGITLEVSTLSEGGGYQGVFTKPNGETLTYKVSGFGSTQEGYNYFYINDRARTEYLYARASAPAYNFEGVEFPAEVNPKIAGPGTYWSYDADSTTLTVSGDGTYVGATTDTQLGSGEYTTVIFGANVSRLLDYCCTMKETTIVFLHAADAALTLGPDCLAKKGSCNTTYLTATVYTDCQAAIDLFSSSTYSANITLHSLSEWEG